MTEATSLSRIGEGNGNPLQCSCLENPRDGGAWWAAVYGVAQSWTRLKRLSNSSSSSLISMPMYHLLSFSLDSISELTVFVTKVILFIKFNFHSHIFQTLLLGIKFPCGTNSWGGCGWGTEGLGR